MTAVGVTVKGAGQLSRALRKAGVELRDLQAANARVAQVVVRASVPLTPRRTGALAGSIRPATITSGATVRAGGGRIRYASFVEYGTSRMGGRPYLTTGMANSQDRWLDVYGQELQKLMDEVAAQSPGTGD